MTSLPRTPGVSGGGQAAVRGARRAAPGPSRQPPGAGWPPRGRPCRCRAPPAPRMIVGDLLGRVDPRVDREPGVAEVEAREAIRAHAQHGHAERLEPLEGGARRRGSTSRPAQTTVMPVRPSVTRSADSSKVVAASRCTPPRPPVANTRIPTRSARCEVAATVAAPWPRRATTVARSRTLTLATSSALAIVSSAVVVEPDPHDAAPRSRSSPGRRRRSAPPARPAERPSRLSGRGRPWLMIVDSRATTGPPRAQRVLHLGGARHGHGVDGTGGSEPAAQVLRAGHRLHVVVEPGEDAVDHRLVQRQLGVAVRAAWELRRGGGPRRRRRASTSAAGTTRSR